MLASYQQPQDYRFDEGTIDPSSLLFPWSGANGVAYVQGTVTSSEVDSQGCLWEWNLITNQKRLLDLYQDNCSLFPSRDGTTLVKHTRIPLSPFQALIPGSLLGVVANELINDRWYHFSAPRPRVGVSIWNTWSLPEKSMRETIILPSYFDRSSYHLSDDGRWLVFYDEFFESDMVEVIEDKRHAQQDRIRIFDTHTGKLWHELTMPYGTLSDRHYLFEGFKTLFPVSLYVEPIVSDVRAERTKRE